MLKKKKILPGDQREEKNEFAETGPFENTSEFRMLLEQSFLAIGFVQDGRFKYVNKAYCDVSGYSYDEVMAWKPNEFSKVIHPDDRAFVLDQIAKKQSGAKDAVTHYQFKGLTKSGEIRRLDLYSQTVTHHGKTADLTMFIDISGPKNADEPQRVNEEWYRAFFKTSRDCIFITTVDGRWIDMNEAGMELFGYSDREELMQVRIADLYANVEDRSRHIQIIAEQGFTKDYAVDLRKKDGKIIHTLITSAARYDESGKVIGFTGTIKDITARKQAEEALAESHRKRQETVRQLEESRNMLQLIIESIPVRVFWKDKASRYLGCNSLLARDAGFDRPDQLIGGDDFAMGWKDQADQYRMDDRQVMESRRPKMNIIEPQTTPSGATIWLKTSKVPLLDPVGEVIGMLGVYEDITDRKREQEKLQQSMDRLQLTFKGAINSLSSIVELRDPYTAGHQERVALLAMAIAREMGLSADQIEGVQVAGIIHDVGKLYIPSEILGKPAGLTVIEYDFVKMHAEAGYTILSKIDFPWPIAEIVYQHHERLNGSGYPRGLSDKEILPEARIIGVADVVEAMTSYRPYRPALSLNLALQEIEHGRGTLYDAAVVDICLKLFAEKRFQF